MEKIDGLSTQDAHDIGLHVNEGKTKYMRYNLPQGDIRSMNGTALDEVDNFLYLGAWVDDTEKDIEVRIAKGWGVLNRMEKIWKSKIKTGTKSKILSCDGRKCDNVRCRKLDSH